MTFRVRRLVQRVAALLLLGIAGLHGGIPILDAAVNHRGAPERLGIHFDKLGGCSSHAERCVLRAADSGVRFTPPATSRVSAIALVQWLGTAPLDVHAGRLAPSSNRSRAPPIALV